MKLIPKTYNNSTEIKLKLSKDKSIRLSRLNNNRFYRIKNNYCLILLEKIEDRFYRRLLLRLTNNTLSHLVIQEQLGIKKDNYAKKIIKRNNINIKIINRPIQNIEQLSLF